MAVSLTGVKAPQIKGLQNRNSSEVSSRGLFNQAGFIKPVRRQLVRMRRGQAASIFCAAMCIGS